MHLKVAQKKEGEKFGDWITADHKVLSEEGESRNNNRYAVVVQDLATFNLIRAKQKLLRSRRKKRDIYSDNLLEFGKSCEYLSWNPRTSKPHRSETNGVAERAVRRV